MINLKTIQKDYEVNHILIDSKNIELYRINDEPKYEIQHFVELEFKYITVNKFRINDGLDLINNIKFLYKINKMLKNSNENNIHINMEELTKKLQDKNFYIKVVNFYDNKISINVNK